MCVEREKEREIERDRERGSRERFLFVKAQREENTSPDVSTTST